MLCAPIAARLREFGERFYALLRALLLTLEEFIGDDFTSEIRHSWITVYGMIAETMMTRHRTKRP